jgi:DNA replication protein DnaC
MLFFELAGSPVAIKIDKTTKKEQTEYLSDPELSGEVRNGYTNIKLESYQSFQQIPDNEERNILYVTGGSGSGKSYYSAEYIHQYIKKHPKHDFFLFSSVGEEKVLHEIKKLNDSKYMAKIS